MGVHGRLYQIGVVVRDIEAGMQHYRDMLGLGPFKRLDTDYHAWYRGRTVHIANANAFARWGDLYLEMVAPGTGDSTAREWLEQGGEGIFHLGYITDDMNQRPAGSEVCFHPLLDAGPEAPSSILHLDTLQALGYFVELTTPELATGLCRWIDEP